ncbi:cytosine deaminase [Alistipes shahii]|uniref:cytosine deaminase n=1 Tax=Alistipes shahii TaxID=328814 RepID=UPI00307A758F
MWTPQGLVRHPLLTLGADGRVLSAECCPDPDRLAATEFYAGLLVPDFPADYRAAFDGMRVAALPLSELLPRIVTPGGALVVISGLDYDSLRLTPQSQIRKL